MGFAGHAFAQRAQENAVRQANDAFGTNIGNEQVGLYTPSDARGFSPAAAGNVRLDGFYVDAPGGFSPRLLAGSQVRVGLTAQSYPFPAPTGVVDYRMRPTGDKPVRSVLLSYGQFNSFAVELDAQQPVVKGRLGLGYGLYYSHYEPLPKDRGRASYGFMLTPRWNPSERVEVRAFYGITQRVNDKGAILIFPGGAALPTPTRARNFSPDWLGSPNLFSQGGLMATAALTPEWTLRAGGFWYDNDSHGVISDAYIGVGPSGVAATRRFTNLKPFDYTSASGELRLSGVLPRGDLQHTVHLTLRGRDVNRTYGGAATASFSGVLIGVDNAPDEPQWTYGADFDDHIRQYSAGAQYQLAFRTLGEVSAGVQRTDYRRELTAPGGADSVTRTQPWLWNGSAAVNLSSRLALYAAMTRGLEEAPVAPEAATNAAEPPAAIRTRQHEFGARWVLRPNLRLVVGYFDIQKPYFNLDGTRTWRELGAERHSGVEASLSGEVLHGLTMVAGYVHQEPRVEGEAVRSGLIADNPVGQPRDTARMSFDYRPFGTPAFSVDATFSLYGSRPVSTRGLSELGGRQLMVPSNVTADLGLRRRFELADRPATLRAQLQNATGTRGWTANTAGGLTIITPRRLFVSLTADF
jgi:hypothetical protein